jgi:hypothetical protein
MFYPGLTAEEKTLFVDITFTTTSQSNLLDPILLTKSIFDPKMVKLLYDCGNKVTLTDLDLSPMKPFLDKLGSILTNS